MFTRLNKQGVQSDHGFTVQVVDRFAVEYKEAGKRMNVEVEFGVFENMKPCVNITKSAFARWDDDSKELPLQEQNRIRKNFTDAMEFQDLAVVAYDD